MNLEKRTTEVCWVLTVACYLLAATGCGSSDGQKMYEVEGVLTHKGKPIPNMTVVFVPEDTATSPQSSGETDENGKFVMLCGKTKGVAPGAHTVFVQDPAALHGAKTSDDPAYLAVLKKYGNEETSPYKITIDEDTEDLELKMD